MLESRIRVDGRQLRKLGRNGWRCTPFPVLLSTVYRAVCHFSASVPCHIALVFGKGLGKDVTAVIIAHEIERVAARRVEGGAKRAFSRVGNRARAASRRGDKY